MHFFVAQLLSIAVNITETYVRHFRNLRPMNRLIYTQTANKNKLRQCAARALSSLTHDPTVV